MQPNDILIMTFMDPQTPQFWVKQVSLIQRNLDADAYSRTRFQLSEDLRSLRVYLD